ncbi:hypothetical protein GNI_098320 [Gregarina niphandrodes]|uniref:Uncharacterized protein n=1 Tax=Gregarina niphandrodes TaxID=110365 RepID=A0A023B4S4_GRENI|nr:hypothetical protein GNI_098320 [Gregarina niphandrodes]EZG57274.1 hypothetical protein GNI_098320 [Gregarina niphandrodes]|eukprot:XP_011131058.1 hypothetical protein GNI_098320 [Gregarina niphandrodes]
MDTEVREAVDSLMETGATSGSVGGEAWSRLPRNLEQLSDREFAGLREEGTRRVWNSYKELLGHQSQYLRDLCVLVHSHVRICNATDAERVRPSVTGATNISQVAAKTASINSQALHTSRIFLEKEIATLVKFARELSQFEACFNNVHALEKEEKRRAVKRHDILNSGAPVKDRCRLVVMIQRFLYCMVYNKQGILTTHASVTLCECTFMGGVKKSMTG